MPGCAVYALTDADRQWAADFLRTRWGALEMISRGRVLLPHTYPGFYARAASVPDATRVGLVTYRIEYGGCEITSLDSLRPRQGIGTALVAAVRQAAVTAGCRRLWLITTNDNLAALRFYQRRGFVLAALHRNALARSRARKPTIPHTGIDDIPLRDEIELEMPL